MAKVGSALHHASAPTIAGPGEASALPAHPKSFVRRRALPRMHATDTDTDGRHRWPTRILPLPTWPPTPNPRTYMYMHMYNGYTGTGLYTNQVCPLPSTPPECRPTRTDTHPPTHPSNQRYCTCIPSRSTCHGDAAPPTTHRQTRSSLPAPWLAPGWLVVTWTQDSHVTPWLACAESVDRVSTPFVILVFSQPGTPEEPPSFSQCAPNSFDW